MVGFFRGIGLAAPGFIEGMTAADEHRLRMLRQKFGEAELEGAGMSVDPLIGLGNLSTFGGGGQQNIPMATPIEPGRTAGAQPSYGPYLAAVGSGPGAFMGQPGLEGRPRGSPTSGALYPSQIEGGETRYSPVMQAADVPNIGLVRERVTAELANNPALQQRFDAITTAEVGQDPGARQKFQEATIMRAVQEGQSLASTLENRAYYPAQTYASARPSGQPTASDVTSYTEPSNASVYATGNASRDPRTGREVGFAGGPQTAASVSPGGALERYGPEGSRGLALAREMGYAGPSKTAIGPQGPGVAEAYAQRGQGAQTAEAGQPPGPGWTLPDLASRLNQRYPNASPMAKYNALKNMAGLLNEAGKSQFAEFDRWYKMQQLAETQRYHDIIGGTKETKEEQQTRAEDIGNAIIEGQQAPTLTGMYKDRGRIQQYLASKGFDLSKAQQEWAASQRAIASLNGPQNTRFRSIGNSVMQLIDEVNNLSETMKLGGVPVMNRLQMQAYIQTQGNSEKGQMVARYMAAVNSLKDEFTTVITGGYAPTESAWKLTRDMINENYGQQQLGASLKEIKRIVGYRLKGLEQVAPMVPGGGENRYSPGGGGGGSLEQRYPDMADKIKKAREAGKSDADIETAIKRSLGQ